LSPRSLQSKPAAARQSGAAPARGTTTLSFDDNRLLMLVFGEHDEHLLLIEDRLGVDVTPRGNKVAIQGTQGGREMARQVLVDLYERALEGLELGRGDVEGAIRMAMVPMPVSSGRQAGGGQRAYPAQGGDCPLARPENLS
jgi:phosphate starvation-inducible PhoH-like protein